MTQDQTEKQTMVKSETTEKPETTGHLVKSLAAKIHWWDYPIFVIWVVALYIFGWWWSAFSASSAVVASPDAAVATLGAEMFFIVLVIYPVLRIGLHYGLKGRKK